MNWFKHSVDSLMDPVLKKVVIRYGALGYAVFFRSVEIISKAENELKINDLYDFSDTIAYELKIIGNITQSGEEIVKEILEYIKELETTLGEIE